MTDKNYFPENNSENNISNDTFEHNDTLNDIDTENSFAQDDFFDNPYEYKNKTYEDNTAFKSDEYNDSYSQPVEQPMYDSGYNNVYEENNDQYNENMQGEYYQNGSYPEYNQPLNDTQYYPPYTAFDNPTDKKTKKEKKGLSRTAAVILIIASILLSSVCGVGGALAVRAIEKNSGTGSLIINKVEKDEDDDDKALNNTPDLSFVEISKKAADSVVEITTESVVTGSFMQQYIASGAGSGVIISADGYIISNNHVINGATIIKVTLRNGEIYDATLIGTDEALDVALLKIEAENLSPAIFGDSETLRVGDTAIAIGNPLGQLGGTVTTGIISALDRDIDIDGNTMSLMQTNAAINPGNSGGGLFNGQGELIGLVVAKSSGEAVEGLGFAIPINDVVDILDDLKEYGYVRGRIYTGMSLIDIPNEQTAAMYGLKTPGVYVNAVDANSAAYSADIQAADRIVSVDGKAVSTADEIESIFKEHAVGDSVKVEIERTSRLGKTTKGTVTLVLEEYIPSLSNRVESNNTSGMQDFSDIFGDIFGGIFN